MSTCNSKTIDYSIYQKTGRKVLKSVPVEDSEKVSRNTGQIMTSQEQEVKEDISSKFFKIYQLDELSTIDELDECALLISEYSKVYIDSCVDRGSIGIDKCEDTYADVGSTAYRLARYARDAKKKFKVVKEAEKERLERKETAHAESWEQVERENKERSFT